jgi:DNA-binding response OmpR family regulator
VTGTKQSILVVEDESSIASFIGMYLKRAGFSVRVSGSGGDALEKASADPPALIILDLMLPDLDGIDVCRRVRQRSDVPILMLSARDEDIDKIIGRREVRVAGDEVQLAPKEFDLLWDLLDHRGLVLTRDQLLERVWGYTFAGDTRTVDVHVRQLRRKLGEACPIVTVWGVGYKVSTEPKAAKVS